MFILFFFPFARLISKKKIHNLHIHTNYTYSHIICKANKACSNSHFYSSTLVYTLSQKKQCYIPNLSILHWCLFPHPHVLMTHSWSLIYLCLIPLNSLAYSLLVYNYGLSRFNKKCRCVLAIAFLSLGHYM